MSASAIIRASAGTGKTYRLVESYVEQIEAGLTPTQIVAITFTRKAAAELRERIRDALVERGHAHETLSQLGRAPISNFHGLALQLLRSLRFGTPTPLRILGDTGDDQALFVRGCESAWFGGKHNAAVEAVSLVCSIDYELPEAMWRAMARAREYGADLETCAFIEPRDWAAEKAALHRELVELCERVRDVLPSLSPKAQSTVGPLFESPLPSSDLEPVAWAEAWTTCATYLDRRTKLKETVSAEAKERMTKGAWRIVADARIAQVAPHFDELAGAAWAQYQELKKHQRSMDFSELVETINARFDTDSKLREQISERVRCVLVDEAQDTNRLQREFVQKLAGVESDNPATLIVVGDWKQSIYTFRGADPKAFEAFADTVEALGGGVETLTRSHRAIPGVVRSVNHLGAHLFEDAYEPISHPDDNATLAGMHWLRVETDAAVDEAAALAADIAAKVKAGTAPGDFALLLSTMPAAPIFLHALGDAGVPAMMLGGSGLYLQSEVRDLSALLSWLTSATAKLDGAIALRSPLCGASDDELLWLFDRDQGAARRTALRGGAVLEEGSLGPAQRANLTDLAQRLKEAIVAARTLTPQALFAHLDALFDVRAVAMLGEGGEQRVANLDRLLGVSMDATRAGQSVERFAADLAARIQTSHKEPLAQLPVQASRAVSILSAHQSKGLEFEHVYLPGLCTRGRGEDGLVLYHADVGFAVRLRRGFTPLSGETYRQARQRLTEDAELEKRRLLYVAVTRAKKSVTFVGSDKLKKTGLGVLLQPWRDAAVRDGVLREGAAPLEKAEPLKPTEVIAPVIDKTMPRTVVPVTVLENYLQCLRRGHFVHGLALPEPTQTRPMQLWDTATFDNEALDPLERGRLAHAVLSRLEGFDAAASLEGFVGTQVRRMGYATSDSRVTEVIEDVTAFLRTPLGEEILHAPVDLRRAEFPFRVPVPTARGELVVYGQIDLLWMRGDRPVVVDYKDAAYSAAAARRYALQLDLYAFAVQRLCETPAPIETLLVFLKGNHAPISHVFDATRRDALLSSLRSVHEGLHCADGWTGEAPDVCRSIGCGYLKRCHPGEVKQTARSGQLSLL